MYWQCAQRLGVRARRDVLRPAEFSLVALPSPVAPSMRGVSITPSCQKQPRLRVDLMTKTPPLCVLPTSECERNSRLPDCKEPGLVADVRYDPQKRLLLIGEADFSFSAALCHHFGDCSALTATSLESRDELLARYGTRLSWRLSGLEDQLCGVHHSVPVNALHQRFRAGSFDCVSFNFPLCETVATGSSAQQTAPRTPRGSSVACHSMRMRRRYSDLASLLDEYFRGASHVLRSGGECHLRLTDQYATSRGFDFADAHGLTLVARLDFQPAFELVYKPLGYRPSALARSPGRPKARGFNLAHSSTFVFQRRLRI